MIEIKSVDFHRNGISGAGFHLVRFIQHEPYNDWEMIGVVFRESKHVAVLTVDDVTDSLGYGHTWRGDEFEDDLRFAILKDNIAEARDCLEHKHTCCPNVGSATALEISEYNGTPVDQVEKVLRRLEQEV